MSDTAGDDRAVYSGCSLSPALRNNPAGGSPWRERSLRGAACSTEFGLAGSARSVSCVRLVLVLAPALVVALANGACGQTVVREVVGNVGSSLVGVARAGDVTGDGVPDFLSSVVANGGVGQQVTHLYSGADGADWASYTNQFGSGHSFLGGADFDGDGVPDVVLGYPSANQSGQGSFATYGGAIHIVSGASGALFRSHAGDAPSNEKLGERVGLLSDLNTDGYVEYWAATGAAIPKVYVFDGASGTVRFALAGSAADYFGSAVMDAGDVNSDGYSDVAVGSPLTAGTGPGQGAVRFYDGSTAANLFTHYGAAYPDSIGFVLAEVGDVNFDGYNDYVSNYGYSVAVLAGGPFGGGVLKMIGTYPGDFDTFGMLSPISDVTGDGLADVLVYSNAPGPDDAVVVGSTGASQPPFMFRCPGFGSLNGQGSLNGFAALGDIDGDGMEDWGACDSGYTTIPFQIQGVVRVYSGRPLYAKASTISAASNYRVDFDINAGVPRAGNQCILLAGATGTFPGVPVKKQVLPLNFDFLTDVSIAFANVGPFHETLGTLDSIGKSSAWFDGSILPPSAVGAKLVFGYYTVGPGGVYVSTNPVEIPVQ